MLKNKKILAIIIAVVVVFTFSWLIIARASSHPPLFRSYGVAKDSPATVSDSLVSAGPKENNTLELSFSDAPKSRTPAKAPPDGHTIIVEKATVCLEIKDREPARECQRINANAGNIFCWSILLNGQGKKVRYIWYINEKAAPSSWLNITGNRFRAWCPKKIDPRASGPARVDIVDEQGRILKSIEFEIIPGRKQGNLQIKYS
ncbi:MAG: DUF2914 domain-containing protein [Planctomycetota bacterium]